MNAAANHFHIQHPHTLISRVRIFKNGEDVHHVITLADKFGDSYVRSAASGQAPQVGDLVRLTEFPFVRVAILTNDNQSAAFKFVDPATLLRAEEAADSVSED